jgi:hypothetical protein
METPHCWEWGGYLDERGHGKGPRRRKNPDLTPSEPSTKAPEARLKETSEIRKVTVKMRGGIPPMP